MLNFDTSGTVSGTGPDEYFNHINPWRWSDLSPFVQGYVEAMFARLAASEGLTESNPRPFGFSDLAPETLARIVEDCGRRVDGWPPHVGDAEWRSLGARFWTQRSTPSRYQHWVPLTPYLGDDGKVYLR